MTPSDFFSWAPAELRHIPRGIWFPCRLDTSKRHADKVSVMKAWLTCPLDTILELKLLVDSDNTTVHLRCGSHALFCNGELCTNFDPDYVEALELGIPICRRHREL